MRPKVVAVVAAGLAGLALGIGLVAWQSMRWTLRGRLLAGVATIGPAAIATFALAFLLAGPLVGFAVAVGGTFVGFAVALRFDGGGDEGGDAEDPPWWPSFERGLRQYERTRHPARR